MRCSVKESSSPYDQFVEEQDRCGIKLLSGGFRTCFFKLRTVEGLPCLVGSGQPVLLRGETQGRKSRKEVGLGEMYSQSCPRKS